MKITAPAGVAELVHERGGRLYVWTRAHRCCSGTLTLLDADTSRPSGAKHRFRELDAGGFELLLDVGARPLPDELVLELSGRGKKIAAFWNNLVWVG
jgi:hypothetical protein